MAGFKLDQQAPLVDGVKPYLEWAVSRRADEWRLESGLARKILKGQERRPVRPVRTRRRGCTGLQIARECNFRIVGKTQPNWFAITAPGNNSFFGRPRSRWNGKQDHFWIIWIAK